MIDIDFDRLPRQDVGDLSVLILRSADDAYCTAVRDWGRLLHKYHAKSYMVNYSDIFMASGSEGLKSFVWEHVNENKIDVMYFEGFFDAEFDLYFLEELRKEIFLVFVADDTALFFDEKLRYQAQAFDLVLTHDYVEKYRFQLFGTNALFFPMVSNPDAYFEHDVDIDGKPIAVSFVGRMDRVGRGAYLDYLAAHEVNVQAYGEGTANGLVGKQEKIDIFLKSKIALNFSGCAEYIHSQHVKMIDKRIRQVKGRIWELALSKALVLTEYAPGLEKSFVIGEELDVFEDKADLLTKIKMYLDDADLRKKVALNGYRRAVKDCHPRTACENLLQVLNRLNKQKVYRPATIHLDDDFLRHVAVRKAIYAVRFLKAGKYRLAGEEARAILRSRKYSLWRIVDALLRELLRPVINDSRMLRRLVHDIRRMRRRGGRLTAH